jgi:hypothetical protein
MAGSVGGETAIDRPLPSIPLSSPPLIACLDAR